MGGDSLSVPILYEANATDFNNLGLGPLVDTTVATVTEERNGQFILEMQYPVDGIRASLIAKNRILKVDAGHKLKDQRFVIKRINRIMGNDGLSYSIYAEHISYITADYALKPNLTINGSGNVAMTQWLNGIIDSNRIHVDSDITTENTTSWTIDKVQNARQALGGVQGSILDVWGGEYRFDNLNISLLRHRGTVSNTLLSYGRNITDFDQEENITNTYTSIYPFASYSVQNGDTSEQKILTIPNLVIDSEYVNNFPNRKIQVVDFSDKFSTDEKPTVERLAELAKSYIRSNKVGVPVVSTKISFVDLSKTENYKEFAPLEELDLCDEVPFAFEKFGIKTTAKVSRIVWNVLLDSYDSLELGELKTNLSDVINNTNNAALDAKDAANDAKNSADNAALSANGKNRNWYGADDPAFGHLSELREGDSWYMPNGEDTELYHWINGQWVFILSTKTANDAADAADKASKEAEEAKKQANKAVDGANDAVSKAGFANDTATQAKSDAAEAGQQAKDALTNAGTAAAAALTAKNDAADALTNAKKALTDSGSAMADSAQARKDSATAKIQAANAATQANQAVTDAHSAKADANTAKANATQAINDAAAAKGQATNALGQANTAIGNALTALNKVNGMSVGGRNYLAGTNTSWQVQGSGSGNQASTVPWQFTFGTIKQAPFKDGDYVTVSFDYTSVGTGAYGSIYPQFNGTPWGSLGGGEAMKDNGHVVRTVQWKPDWTTNGTATEIHVRMDNVATTRTVTVYNMQFERGNKDTDWSAAPEDVQQQFTDINGELANKVSQTTYNTLAGTVDTVSTLAKQNQATITTLATKTSVDTVSKTATTAQTLAQQNATELLNKANSTTVDTLTQRVTTAESTLSQTATKAELALTNTDVDKLNDTVASQALDIAATADGLKLKADSSTVSDLAGNVTKNSAQLELTATKAELQVAQTNVDNLKKTVTSNTAGMTANANALKLKADSSTVSDLDGRVTSLSGQLDVQSDLISAKVTASDVTGMLGNYATQTWAQSQIKSTADSINLSVTKVQTNLDNLTIGGRNYLLDTGNAKPWLKGSGATNQIYGTWVFSFDSINNAPFVDGDPVTLSFSYITTGTGAFGTIMPQFNGTPWGELGGSEPMKDTGRITHTVNWKSEWTTTGTATGITIRMDNVATTRTVMVYNVQFESGNKATDHKVAPEDMATVEKLSELQVTVNGIQGTVQNKADQSQITQLAGKISLKADTTALDTLKGTVDKQGSAIDVNTKAIALKANQSTVDTLTGRVSTAEGKITVQADQIAQTVSKTELTSKLNGYATETWTQSQIKSTADQINLSVSKVQGNLDTLQISERNTALGTANLVHVGKAYSLVTPLPTGPVWLDFDYTTGDTTTEWRINLVLIKKDGTNEWNNLITKGSANEGGDIQGVHGHYSALVNWPTNVVDMKSAYLNVSLTSGSGMITVNHLMLTRANRAPQKWQQAPEDSATEVQFAELAVKVDGIQTTVSGKADKSQVTQMAGQITSVVGDVSANSSQITQMKADINLSVKAGDVVNQINISPESILIAGQKVHITGQTTIDNAVIKDAMIADIKADKITAGTLNAANVNVINLNAANITTGTLRGANLSMNLNTGEVLFQKGSIKSANGNLNLDISKGTMAVINEYKSGFYFEDGKLVLNDGWLEGTYRQPKYGSLEYNANFFTVNGLAVKGTEGVTIGTPGYNPLGMFTSVKESGIAIDKKHIEIGSVGPTTISSGNRFFMNLLTQSPFIAVGTTADGSYMTTDKPGSRISLYAEYVHIKSAYLHTSSASANVVVTEDGALVRSTSASKYKTDIIRANATDYGDKLLNLPTATWTDIAETKRYRDDPVNQIKPTRNFGMIAEDLAEAGLEMLVVRGTDGELEGINYDRIGPALIPVIAKLKNKIEKLEQKLEEPV